MSNPRRRGRIIGASVAVLAASAATVAVVYATAPMSDVDAATSPAASPSAHSAAPAETEERVTPSPHALASPPVATPGRSPEPSAEPSSAPGPTPRASSTPAPDETPDAGDPPSILGFVPVEADDLKRSDAERLVTAAVTAPIESLAPEQDDLASVFADIASDAYADEIEAQWTELSENGWTVDGQQQLDDLEITSLDGAETTVEVCIDSSDVTLIDAAGEPIGSDSARTPRARHLFTLEKSEGVWRVTDRTFPDDPTC